MTGKSENILAVSNDFPKVMFNLTSVPIEAGKDISFPPTFIIAAVYDVCRLCFVTSSLHSYYLIFFPFAFLSESTSDIHDFHKLHED